MDCITLDVKTNWALKLGNLRRLKKSLDKYIDEELKIKSTKFDRIDLPLIARSSRAEEIIKLFESLMFAILNCPKKTIYIRRIMDLDESVQMQLMYFIQNKVMGEGETKPGSENESQRKEIESLKYERKKLSEQVSELEQELSLAHEEYAILHSDYQALKFDNERLILEVEKRTGLEAKETNIIEMELKGRLSEKDESIIELKKTLEKTKKRYETEIVQLKDELDIANSKLVESMNIEKMMNQYKKRVESFGNVKAQLDELQRSNDSLTNTVNSQQDEIEGLLKIKHSYVTLKESLDKEKSKNENLNFVLEAREKLIKKIEKSNCEYKQKVDFLTKQNEELMNADFFPESSHASEDSFCRYEKEAFPIVRELRIKNFPSVSQGEQFENLNAELKKQTALIEIKKTKLKKLKENIRMVSEDGRSRILEVENYFNVLQVTFEKLQNDNLYLSEEIQKLNETLHEKETELFAQKQIIEDLEELKASKTSTLADIRAMSAEKDEFLRQISTFNEKMSELNSVLLSKDQHIKDLNSENRARIQQIQVYKERETLLEKEIQLLKSESLNSHDTSDRVIVLEKENIEYRSQIALFNSRIEEKNQRILELTKENKVTSEDYKQKFAKLKEDYDRELEAKNQEMIKQTEEATSILMKQREQLAARLQTERRNTIMNFSQAMSVKENFPTASKEVFKLRQLLIEREKEISRLSRNCRELKVCWKQAAKLLKAVYKELGRETEKIEDAVRERLSI